MKLFETCGKQSRTDCVVGLRTRIRWDSSVASRCCPDNPSCTTVSTKKSTIQERRSLPSNSCSVKWHQQQESQTAVKKLWHFSQITSLCIFAALYSQKLWCVCHQFQLIQHKRSSVPFISTHDANGPIQDLIIKPNFILLRTGIIRDCLDVDGLNILCDRKVQKDL